MLGPGLPLDLCVLSLQGHPWPEDTACHFHPLNRSAAAPQLLTCAVGREEAFQQHGAGQTLGGGCHTGTPPKAIPWVGEGQ